ncbi:MAG: nucleotide exchange factor GrpE [Candidatus Omnitrophica bacterium]|nr:nucleotide exchange factor GrpE [Candidatus Omnitrophota bacterium]
MKKDSEDKKEVKDISATEKKNHKDSSGEQPVSSEWEELRRKANLAEEYYDKLLRLGAEFENARRRMQKEKEDFIFFANQKLLSELLPIADDFERLLEGLEKNHIDEGLSTGIKIIHKRLQEVLEKNGLVRMKVIGEKFDPTRHEALMIVDTTEHPEDTIVEEIRSGYLLYNKVLRPAVVKVAKRKEKSSAPEQQSTN